MMERRPVRNKPAALSVACLVLWAVSAVRAPSADAAPVRGRLANPGFENERVRTTLFFSGQARDGTNRYGVDPGSNLSLYTLHPSDARHLNWSVSAANREFALDRMIEAGVNVITMSSWGEDFLPYDQSWIWAPMQTAPASHDELFAAAVGKPVLIMPMIESRANWSMRAEFPRWTDGKVAPGTVSQIKNLISRYVQNTSHPEWAGKWAQIHDRNGEARYAVVLIHAASDRLTSSEHAAFAVGFDLIAAEVLAATGVKVGFLLDVLPPGTNAPGVLCPSPASTGPHLEGTPSVLGIQCFIPEIWYNATNEADRIAWKRNFSQQWSNTGIPFLMDVCPGYDAHLVFPGSYIYGHNASWIGSLTSMVRDFGDDGTVYNSWNGYTEAMAFMPNQEYGDWFFRWGKHLSVIFPHVPHMTAEPAWTSGTQNTVAWNAAPGASTYTVQCSDRSDFSPVLSARQVSSPTVQATFASLSDGETYGYRVRAENAAGASAWSVPTSSTQDATAPTVSMASTAPDPTRLSAIPVTVAFNEAVTGFEAGDIEASNGTVDSFSGTGANYAFQLRPTGQGRVSASILAGVAQDRAGNPNKAATPLERTYDSVAPAVDSIVRADASPTSAVTVRFTVTFTESVSGVDAGDFAVALTGTLDGVSVTGVTGAGDAYEVSLDTGRGEGTIRLDAVDDDSVADTAGNPLGGPDHGNGAFTEGQVYTIERPQIPTAAKRWNRHMR